MCCAERAQWIIITDGTLNIHGMWYVPTTKGLLSALYSVKEKAAQSIKQKTVQRITSSTSVFYNITLDFFPYDNKVIYRHKKTCREKKNNNDDYNEDNDNNYDNNNDKNNSNNNNSINMSDNQNLIDGPLGRFL